MSKPDKPGELRNVTVTAISLVSKAANKEKFKIFKSAEPEPDTKAPETSNKPEGNTPTTSSVAEPVKKDERGLFSVLKEFFTGGGTEKSVSIAKGAVADIVHATEKGKRLCGAFDALMTVLKLSRWGDDREDVENDPVKINAAIEDFYVLSKEILLGEEVKKSAIVKSGKKISSSRLSKLKDMQTMLNDILSDVEDEEPKKGDTELTKEEVQKTVDDAIKPVSDGIKDAIEKTIAPLVERIEKIENARGVSNRLPDETIEKTTTDFWGGIF